MNSNPKLSIVCIAYNQEKFIRQALESFVMQKTDFDFDVIIGDDGSTDKTVRILKEFEKKYPKIIKPIYREKNIGAISNFIDTLSRVKSEYVSLCEGDDYFTDPHKLKKQVECLEKNRDYSFCFHPAKVVYEGSEERNEIFPSFEKRFGKEIFGLDDLLVRNFFNTNSVVYRWRFVDENIRDVFPENIIPGDWFLHMLHAQKGKFGFIDEVMAVYRKHPEGIWWESDKDIDKIHLRHGIQELNFFDNVLRTFAGNSNKYLDGVVMPFFKHIVKLFLTNKKFAELEETSNKYGDLYDLIIRDMVLNRQEVFSKNIDNQREQEAFLKNIDERDQEIELMKSSKFWKLRDKYLKFKSLWNSQERE